jgi:hypothetical protein
MGFVSTIALFLPILVILLLRLGTYRSFPVLVIYYASSLGYNMLTEHYVYATPEFIRAWGLVNNFMDVPLILYFLTYFSTSRAFTHRMRLVILSFIAFELIVATIIGFNINAITIILGVGFLIVLGFSLYFFIRQAKMAIIHRKAMGKALIVSSVLFAYGCFSFIYLMYYVFKAHLDEHGVVKPQYKADTFLVYFLVATFSSLMMSAGILIERKRIQKLNELKITRKELSSIYTETKRAAPYRAAMLDFDKDQWN